MQYSLPPPGWDQKVLYQRNMVRAAAAVYSPLLILIFISVLMRPVTESVSFRHHGTLGIRAASGADQSWSLELLPLNTTPHGVAAWRYFRIVADDQTGTSQSRQSSAQPGEDTLSGASGYRGVIGGVGDQAVQLLQLDHPAVVVPESITPLGHALAPGDPREPRIILPSEDVEYPVLYWGYVQSPSGLDLEDTAVVRVRISIDESGHLIGCYIISESHVGRGFGKAVQTGLRMATHVPMYFKGIPCKSSCEYTVYFCHDCRMLYTKARQAILL